MSRKQFSDLEIDVLAFLLKKGEQRFVQIAKALFPQHAKSFGKDENHFKVALVRKLDALKEDGYVEKKIKSSKNVCYNIPEQKREEVEKIVRRYHNLKEIETLSDEEIEKLVKENKRLKRLNRIMELEQLHVLPLQAVLKKLEQMGFNSEELYPNFYVEKTKNGERHHYGSRRKITNFAGGAFFDDFKPEDIEIILEPAHKYKDPKDFLTQIAEEIEYGPEWIVLTEEPVKGYYILGAYKELLQLYQEEFEFEWLKWKEEFNLSDEDWKIVGPWVCFKMLFDAGRVDLPIEIQDYLYEYTLYRKPNAFEELKELYTRHFGERGAEAQAEKTIQHFKRLEETPVKELWQEVEEDLLPVLNETNRRIFQYLKNKYGESLRI